MVDQTRKNHKLWRWLLKSIVVGCIFIICNSSMSKSFSGYNKCMQQGSYKFTHYRSLENDSRCQFKDGDESSNDSGYTILAPVSDGFTFTGGKENRWQVSATCLNEETVNVQVTLHNKGCQQKYVTTSTTTFDVGEEGEILISEYDIQWTCGDESLSCNMVESWSLIPEIW